jgi:fibronectin-binding autotransporter adhesin
MSHVYLIITTFAFLFGGNLVHPLVAASFYWVGGGSSASAPASGNWDVSTTDWSATATGSPTTAWGVAGSTAVFGGVDGTYGVSVNATVNKPQILQFLNSGYTLSNATTPQTISFNGTGSGAAPNIQVASGKTAAIGTNFTIATTGTTIWGNVAGTAGGELDIQNGGTLSLATGTIGMVGSGTLTSVQTGGKIIAGNSGTTTFLLGSVSSDNCTLSVDGGSVACSGTTTIKVGGNGTATSLTGTLNVNSGSFSQSASSSAYMALGWLSGNVGYVYLNGGNLTVNQIKQGGGSGYMIFNGGTLMAASGNFATTFLTGLSLAPVRNNGAVINNNGFNITINQALQNSLSTGFFPSDNAVDGGLIATNSGAGGSLILTGPNTYNGPTVVNSGAYLATTTASTGGGSYTVNDGSTLEAQVASSGGQLAISSLTLGTSGTLTNVFTLGANASTTTPAVAASTLALNGTVTVNVTGSGLIGPNTYLLLSYGSTTGSGSFVAGSLPAVPGYVGSLTNDTTAKQLELVYTQAPQPVSWAVGSGNWDTTTKNWYVLGTGSPLTNYLENAALSAFDDSASGSSPITVTLTGDHSPIIVTNNSTKNYILAGSSYNLLGSILTKDGSSTLTLDNGNGNSFSSISINNGTLQVGNGDANGSLGGSGVTNNGTLAFNRTDNPTFANVISGSGGVTQNGSGAVTLSGANTYSGLTVITNGQLIIGNGSGLQNSVVSNNAPNGLGFASSITNVNVTISGLAGTGNITLTNVGTITPVVLIVNNTTASTTYGGNLLGGKLAKKGTNTLVLTGNSAVDTLTLGSSSDGGLLQVANGATLSVGSGTNSLIWIGVSDASARTNSILDASAAANFTANVNTFLVGYANGSGLASGTVILATNNNITASAEFSVSKSGNTFNNVNSTVTAPNNSTTTIQTPSMIIGNGKGLGFFTLGSGATLNVAGTNGGRAVLQVGSTYVSGGSGTWSGSLDASAGIFNGSLSELLVGQVNAPTSSMFDTGMMTLSANAANHLDISGGSAAVVYIGAYTASSSVNAANGTLTIGNLDATSQIVSTNNGVGILIGSGGANGTLRATGTLNLNGGTLTITTAGTGISGDMVNLSNLSTNNYNGVTLKAGTNCASFINGLTAANVLSNGVRIDDGGFNVTIPQALVAGDIFGGGLTKLGAGTLTLSGVNTYTGNTTVSNGTLLVNGSISSNAVVTATGTLGGIGSIGGSVTVNAGGTLAPGSGGVGTLTIDGNLTLNGNLAFALNELLSPSNSICVVSGTPNNTGTGTLTITNLGPALTVGDKFTLFSPLLPNGNALTILPPSGVTFTNMLAVDGSIQVLSVSTTASNPTNITFSVSGSTMTLSWPQDHLGWIAQSNSVSLSNTNYWFDVPNSQSGTNLVITINHSLTNVFYRLRHP